MQANRTGLAAAAICLATGAYVATKGPSGGAQPLTTESWTDLKGPNVGSDPLGIKLAPQRVVKEPALPATPDLVADSRAPTKPQGNPTALDDQMLTRLTPTVNSSIEHKERMLLESAYKTFINQQSKEPSAVLSATTDLLRAATIICARDAGQMLTKEEYDIRRSNLPRGSVAVTTGVSWYVLDAQDWPGYTRFYDLLRQQRSSKNKGQEFSFSLSEEDREMVLALYEKALNVLNKN